MEKISVAITGASGKMGREVLKAVSREKEMCVTAAVDPSHSGQDAGSLAGIGSLGIKISPFLENAILSKKPDVLVDFTRYEAALTHLEIALKHKVACVIGTTGFSEEDYKKIQEWCEKFETSALIAPNFAVGAVLLMKFAKEASKYYAAGEIIDLHHEKKLDAPSGTALRTAALMRETRSEFARHTGEEKISGARGGDVGGIRIHSVRLPGFVAHQEVIFGGEGEILTLRHDSLSRESFMPGVLLGIRKVRDLKGLVVGLENILE
jgi:4-hydroxy-tetrahydrodipicolinate reductase